MDETDQLVELLLDLRDHGLAAVARNRRRDGDMPIEESAQFRGGLVGLSFLGQPRHRHQLVGDA